MFGGKKEKALEEQLSTLTEKYEYIKRAIGTISKEKDNSEETFVQLTITKAQMEQDITLVKEQLGKMAEVSGKQSETVRNLNQELNEVMEKNSDRKESHQSFFSGIKLQNEDIAEVVEKNKYFTTPMKEIAEIPDYFKEEEKIVTEKIDQMLELSKNMGVLSLNAAIEAGRMGDAGKKFISAAEEIRTFSEEYSKTAVEVQTEMKYIQEKMQGMEEQIRLLNELLKENNSSMCKVLKEGSAMVTTYEAQNQDDGNDTGKLTDLLHQFIESDSALQEMQNRLALQVQGMESAFGEQKSCTGELESSFERMSQSVEKVSLN